MRIDKYLSEKFGSRTKASEAILAGLVKVNGKTVSPSYDYVSGEIEIIEPKEWFVSNGGYKLSKALKDFHFSVEGKTFVDVGASTGGFTDCLLQNGAKKVYCIDVGESQLDRRLLCDKVVVIDNFNARNLDPSMFKEKIDGVVIDVSFISLTYVLGGVAQVLNNDDYAIALIKPQFECESRKVGKNGIVRDKKQRLAIIKKIFNFAINVGLCPINLTKAPEREGKNVEYLVLLQKGNVSKFNMESINKYAEI